MEIQRQSEAFAYRLAAPPVSRHYSTKVLQGIHKTAADLVKDYTDNLYKEFHDWIDEQGAWPVGGHGPADYTKPMGGPLTYWDNIEGFFKERYPEAYRGFNMAEEKARPLMDTGYCGWSDQTRQAKPYETGPEAEAKYGYDPRQLAAGMMYLHNWSHAQSAQNAWRGKHLPRDIDRLSDIFQKRMQMQEDARQRKLVNANTIRCGWKRLYRGLKGVEFPPRIRQMIRDEHPDAANAVLDFLNTGGQHGEGVGIHWTPDRDMAYNFGGNWVDSEPAGVVLHGVWNGQGRKDIPEEDIFPGENETQLHHGTPVNVHTISINLGDGSMPKNQDESGFPSPWFHLPIKRRITAKELSSNTIHCASDYDELYHLTDNPDFALDPDYIPSTLGEEGGPGIYLTDDPGHWAGTNVDKPYIATFRVPAGYDEMFDPDYGHEGSYFVPHDLFDLIELAQVSPRKRLSSNTIRCATDDYRGYHRGPDADYGSSMDNPDGVFPDIDTHPEYYDTYQPYDYESHHQIRRVRGKPDSWVTVYRALPLSVLQHKTYRGGPNDLYEGSKPYSYRQREAPINTNDWVTPSYSYAQEHGEANLSNEPWTIVQQRVRARSLFSEGNSIHEWAYNGEPIVGTEGDRARRERGLRTRKTKRSNTIRCAADDDLILYHGTGADSVPHIQQNGLMHPPGVSPAGWPMLTTDFDQAKAYATRDNPVVLEYHVPANLTYGRWRTHRTGEEPYLWDAEPHTAYDYPAQSYALKRPLPATFLRAVHPVQRKLASRNTIRCATSIPSLTDTWKDFVDWAGGDEDEAYVGAQWWPNLEQYLSDRHGLSNKFQYTEDKDEYYSHPMVLQMGKIHAFAHSREDGTPDITDSEKLEAAAMGLINLRKRVDQQRQNLIDDPNSPYYYDPGEWV